MIIWLVYAELFRLDAICLYCTTIHAITVALFVTVVLGAAATGPTVTDATDHSDLVNTIDGSSRDRSHSLRKSRTKVPLRP